MIHIEKLKKLKPGILKESGKKDSIDLDDPSKLRENGTSVEQTPNDGSPIMSPMRSGSNSSDERPKYRKKYQTAIKKNAHIIKAKKELLESEHFFDNRPDMKQNLQNMPFERVTGRIDKH